MGQKSFVYQLKTGKLYRQAMIRELKITSNRQSCSDFVSFFYKIFFTIPRIQKNQTTVCPFSIY